MSTNYATLLPSASYGNLLFLDNGGLDLGLGNVPLHLQDGLGNYSTVTMSQTSINFSRDYPNQFMIGGVALTADINALNALTANNGPIVSVAGAAGQIDVTVGVDPIISIDPTYVGQTSITTLGTIVEGVWESTAGPVNVEYGGTGTDGFNTYGVICGGVLADSELQSVVPGANGTYLQSTGTSSLPVWASVPALPTLTSNQILYSNASNILGGLTYSPNTILGTSGSNTLSFLGALPVAVQGQITQLGSITSVGSPGYLPVTVGGTGASSWIQSGVLYATATHAIGQVAPATNSIFVTNNVGAGVPILTQQLPIAVEANISQVGTILSGQWQSATAPIGAEFGGTGLPSLPVNRLLVGNGTDAVQSVAPGSVSRTILQQFSPFPEFSQAVYPYTTNNNEILYSNGFDNIEGLPTANNGVLITSNTGVPSISSQLPAAVLALITQLGTVTSGLVNVTAGGTGLTTTTANGVICGGTTPTGLFQNAGAGTAGQFLQSNGSASLPTWGSIVTSGTFTPALRFGGSSTGITYGQQSGKYLQIGNIVYFNVLLNLNSTGSATGAATIAGFPVSAAADIPYNVGTALAENMSLGVGNTNIYMSISSGTLASLYQTAPALGATALSNTNFTSSSILSFNGFYFTS